MATYKVPMVPVNPEKDAQIRKKIQDNIELFSNKDTNELFAFSEQEGIFDWKTWMNLLYKNKARYMEYHLVFKEDFCEIHLEFLYKQQSFRWRFYSKEASFFMKQEANKTVEFRGKTYIAHYNVNNELAFVCRKDEHLSEALALFKTLQEIFPVPIHNVLVYSDIFSKPNSQKISEKLIDAIDECDNLSIMGEMERLPLAILVDNINVSNHLAIPCGFKELPLLGPALSQPRLFFMNIKEHVPVHYLLRAGSYGCYGLHDFSVIDVNLFIRMFLNYSTSVVKTLLVVIGKNDVENIENVLLGLQQHGVTKRRYDFRFMNGRNRKQVLLNYGVDIRRSDLVTASLMLPKMATIHKEFHSFVFYVQYTPFFTKDAIEYLKCPNGMLEETLETKDLKKLERVNTEQLEKWTSQHQGESPREARRSHKGTWQDLESKITMSQLRLEYYKLMSSLNDKRRKASRRTYGYFTLPQ